jgi:hypothetical protein
MVFEFIWRLLEVEFGIFWSWGYFKNSSRPFYNFLRCKNEMSCNATLGKIIYKKNFVLHYFVKYRLLQFYLENFYDCKKWVLQTCPT